VSSKLKIPLKSKVRVILKSILTLLSKPTYIVLMVISMISMAGLIIWSLNLELIAYIIFDTPLTIFEKLEFFAYGYQSLFTSYDSFLSLGIIIFSFLFGINIGMLAYVIRRQGLKSIPKKSGGSGFMFAILGGGCVACGTSLLAPVLATVGATSVPLLRGIGAIFTWAGSVLIVYSIYQLSLLVASSNFKDSNNKQNDNGKKSLINE